LRSRGWSPLGKCRSGCSRHQSGKGRRGVLQERLLEKNKGSGGEHPHNPGVGIQHRKKGGSLDEGGVLNGGKSEGNRPSRGEMLKKGMQFMNKPVEKQSQHHHPASNERTKEVVAEKGSAFS